MIPDTKRDNRYKYIMIIIIQKWFNSPCLGYVALKLKSVGVSLETQMCFQSSPLSTRDIEERRPKIRLCSHNERLASEVTVQRIHLRLLSLIYANVCLKTWRYAHFTTFVNEKCNRTVQQSTWVSEPHKGLAMCKEKYCLSNRWVSYRIERAIFHSANSSPSTELIRWAVILVSLSISFSDQAISRLFFSCIIILDLWEYWSTFFSPGLVRTLERRRPETVWRCQNFGPCRKR